MPGGIKGSGAGLFKRFLVGVLSTPDNQFILKNSAGNISLGKVADPAEYFLTNQRGRF